MLDEGGSFGDKCKAVFSTPQCAPDQRSTTVVEGPAHLFAMDSLLSLQLQDMQKAHMEKDLVCSVLDRDYLAGESLICI